MTKKKDDKGFCCPEFVPPGAPDDFCIPENCCPPRLKTPKYPSPTSCLPKEQTRELEELIDRTNELLLDLALSSERPEEGRMRAFDGLFGQLVEVLLEKEEDGNQESKKQQNSPLEFETTVEKELPEKKPVQQKQKKKRYWTKKRVKSKKTGKRRGKKTSKNKRNATIGKGNKKSARESLKGFVHLSGRDFVLLRKDKEKILIPLRRVALIKARDRFAQPIDEPALLDIDPCLRRAITFNFGKTVASSPELIEIFFRLTTAVFLLIHFGKKVKIKIEDEEVHGTLKEVNKESIVISMKNDKEKIIPIQSISYLIINEN